jgi:hypothetical protein
MSTQAKQIVASITLVAVLGGCATTASQQPMMAGTDVGRFKSTPAPVVVAEPVPVAAADEPSVYGRAYQDVPQVAPAPSTAEVAKTAAVVAAGVAVGALAILAIIAGARAPMPAYVIVPAARCNFWRCW